MTPTQIARRSDALYSDGTCGMTRRVLCDMVAQREADLEDARAENARLRSELDSVGTAAYLYGRGGIKAENAKLRKLARMMWLACKSNGIVGCIYAYPDKNSNADERIRFEPLLRELGIEVEG